MKVRAAVALLELAVKVEVDELAERVAALDTGKFVLQLCGFVYRRRFGQGHE